VTAVDVPATVALVPLTAADLRVQAASVLQQLSVSAALSLLLQQLREGDGELLAADFTELRRLLCSSVCACSANTEEHEWDAQWHSVNLCHIIMHLVLHINLLQ